MSAALSGVVRFCARTSSDGGALAARSWAGTFGRGAFIFGHMRTHDTAWLFWFRVGELNLLGLLRGADFARTFVRPQPCSARRGKSEHPPSRKCRAARAAAALGLTSAAGRPRKRTVYELPSRDLLGHLRDY